jgi:hypothetical protein
MLDDQSLTALVISVALSLCVVMWVTTWWLVVYQF